MKRAVEMLVIGLVASLGLATTAGATGAELVTRDGVRIQVTRSESLALPGGGMAGQAIPGATAPTLRYGIERPDGTVQRGTIAGSDEVASDHAPTLTEDPLTGRVHLVFGVHDLGDQELVSSIWDGAGWSAPIALTNDDLDDVQPSIAAAGDGGVVLAWRRERGPHPSTVIRHSVIGEAGELFTYSFSELGDVTKYLEPVSGDVKLHAGLSHVAVDVPSSQAYLFFADPETDEVGAVRLSLQFLGDIFGGSAAPVPVTLNSRTEAPEAMSAGGSGGPESGVGEIGFDAGERLAPFRMELHGHEAYYWFEDTHVRAVVFGDGEALPMLSVLRSGSDEQAHFEIFLAIRKQILHLEDRSGRDTRRRIGDRGDVFGTRGDRR